MLVGKFTPKFNSSVPVYTQSGERQCESRVSYPSIQRSDSIETRIRIFCSESIILIIRPPRSTTDSLHAQYLILFSCCFPGSCPMQTTRKNCCVFPFIYRRRRYTSCTSVKSKRPWCATTSNYDKDKMWGYCPGGVGEE